MNPMLERTNMGRGRPSDFAHLGLPTPIQLESLPMPADYGVGLHNAQGRTPIRPEPGKPYPKHSVAWPQPRPFGLLFQNSQLLPEREVFNGQFRSVAKQRSDQQPN